MPRAMSKTQVASELLQTLDENNLNGFIDAINMGLVVDADWEHKYGKESGHKTILQLAIEEDDGEPYVEELLKVGAKANYFNGQIGSAPIHTAATEAMPDIFKLLLKYPDNKADVNAADKDGLTAFHILLAQLIDLANLETTPEQYRTENLPTEEDIDISMMNVLDCLVMLLEQKDLRMQFNKALTVTVDKSIHVKSKITLKKLCLMTPLQIVCSFQTWNAKPISDSLHNKLEETVSLILAIRGVDPNATAAKGALAGAVAGSTPAVMLAATRGYHKVIEVFKRHKETDFLIENKFKQTILHVVLKAGYYNKIAIHGDDSGEVNSITLQCLFDDNNPLVRQQMRGLVNRLDSYGNSALHYAKPYPNPSAAKTLLANGAKLDKNPQGVINVNPRTLEEHFYEHCIVPEGDDIDDEEFRIRINYKLFEKSNVNDYVDLSAMKAKTLAWTMDMAARKKSPESLPEEPQSSGKVDTKRLEYFSDVNSLHYLLKHPVLASFLEMELNSMRIRYWIDFLVYLFFVLVMIGYFSNRYGFSKSILTGPRSKSIIYQDDNIGFIVTYSFIVLLVVLIILIILEIYQIIRLGKRYFRMTENYIQWTVIILVVLNLIPSSYLDSNGEQDEVQRHIAALTLLIAFIQLYILLVRIFPNTSIPVYINMYTTVLKTYTLILLSYFAFLLSFAYSFFLIFHPYQIFTNGTLTNSTLQGDPLYVNVGLSLVKTIVTFVGEISYNNLIFGHWLGYVILVLYIFLVMIVLMNVLNGLAVSDIRKIRAEVDTYYHVSIVESLAYTSFVSLLAEEVVLYPNIRPENHTICGLAIPGASKVYRARGGRMNEPDGKKKEFYFREDTVKAAKELVSLKQQQIQSMDRVTLETVRDCVLDVKREQNGLKQKLGSLEEAIKTVLEIMISRQPIVERI